VHFHDSPYHEKTATKIKAATINAFLTLTFATVEGESGVGVGIGVDADASVGPVLGEGVVVVGLLSAEEAELAELAELSLIEEWGTAFEEVTGAEVEPLEAESKSVCCHFIEIPKAFNDTPSVVKTPASRLLSMEVAVNVPLG